MINLITAPPGVGKTLFATMQLIKHDEANKKNLPLAKSYYIHNLELLSNHADKLITIDLAEFKGNQNLFKEIRLALDKYDGQQITLLEYFSCFNHYDFSDFYSDKVTPDHYYLSTSYNLISNFANKVCDTKFKMIPPVRQIYSDINGLRIEDVLESPDDWRTCPDGSIIFYDEVQNRPIYKNVRDKNDIVSELTVHRHRGFDIYFITQFPVLIHTEVRAVVGQHYHLFRPWGLPQAYVHVWSYAVVDPNSFSKKRAAERTFRFSYDKKIYKLYTSSTMHTHKVTLPKKLLLYAGGLLFGFYLIYDGISGGTIFNKGKDNQAGIMDKVNTAKDSNPYANDKTANKDEISPELAQKIKSCTEQFGWTPGQCREAYDPQFLADGQAKRTVNTVFIYDASKPYNTVAENVSYEITSKPVFSGCTKFGNKYQAYTEQGTKLKVSSEDCKRLIDNNDRPYNYFKKPESNASQIKNIEVKNNENPPKTEENEQLKANNQVEPHLQAKVTNGANDLAGFNNAF
ncbi:zonular occludens toxin domain-containing protein [Acinetobacter guillouiae]|uniref:zonular occludens toxin domain-containing protein n=1 Tax=Acinetobacter TaxID=469 RepID=UPI001FB97A20|nr:zonular occludens toxin domain-containing protein [Acinetobacter sp. NyZ410]UOH16492.1 zonular occludens toxin domain-containing protein [Acinetobacter sp. NyZ410]